MTGKDSKHSTPAGRKPKPRDLGEVHKPSRKVALNEVLQSLQDLVHNELSVPDKTSPASQDGIAPTKREPSHRAEAIEPGTIAPPARDNKSPPARDNEPPPARKSEPRAARSARSPAVPAPESSPPVIPPGGLQQELPYLDPVETIDLTPVAPPPDPEPPAPTEPSKPTPSLAIEAEASELAPLEPLPEDSDPAPSGVTTAAEEGDLGEIPVLEDIIDFNDEPEPRTDTPAVPPAADARRLAIQVAARLNVELRKAGKPSLSSDVITRLARLLEEALAKAGANMENKPPEKH